MLESVYKKWIDKLFPYYCLLCGSNSERDLALCQACENDLPWINNACSQCSIPLANNNLAELICAHCLQQKPAYDRTFALFSYQHPINHFISRLKFHNKLLYAACIGQLIAKRLSDFYSAAESHPQWIIPMPLHKQRLQQRGFNQALEIARPIHKKLGFPLINHHCQRNKATAAQSSLNNSKARRDNVKQAFQTKPFPVKHILIIDDVITTANTINEFSRSCRQQGAERIDVACCARTSLG